MIVADSVYQSLADINLWFKIQTNDVYTMMDIPSIISGRWVQLKNNWGFLVDKVLALANDQSDPDFVREQINDFTNFIETQRTTNTTLNPLSDKQTIHRYYEVFNILPITIIPINNDEQKTIDIAIKKVSAYTKRNFIEIKNTIRKARDEAADISSVSDDAYNKVFNRSSINAQTEVSIDDIKFMQQLQNGIKACDFILSNITSLESVSVDPFALLKANANNPDIPLETYSSGKLVKMNFGDDLKTLADTHLGNPDKWIEIAVANGLRPPYIDEIGIKIKLLSNANSNQINVARNDDLGNQNLNNFYIGQLVILQSSIEITPEQRKIIDIKEVPISGDLVIEVDGESNLSRYKVNDNANVRVYKKNTTHSGFYILIPSNDPINPETFKDTPWFLQTKLSDEKQAKVDLALKSNGDIIFTSNSDLQLSYGVDNAIQAVKLKLATELGELRRHKEYGLVSVQGFKNIDIDSIKQALIQSINYQIENDSRFERVVRLDVTYFNIADPRILGTAFIVSLIVQLAGSTTAIPISFNVNVT
jgi:hypothetical protein